MSDVNANKIVNTYILCAMINPEDISSINDQTFLKRWNIWFNDNFNALKMRNFINDIGGLRTIDERTLYVLQQKLLQYLFLIFY